MMNSSTNGQTEKIMAQAEKYLFETTFDADGQILHDAATSGPKKVYTPDEVEEIRQAAYTDGLSGVEAQTAQQNAQILGQISESMVQVISHLDQEVHRIKEEAAALAMAVADRLCATLLKKEPEAEIIALIAKCLEQLPSEPHIVVRVGEALAPTVKPAINDLAAQKGFNGKIIVIPEPDLQSADCRIEWADGGIERNASQFIETIDAVVQRHLQAEQKIQGDLFEDAPNWMTNADATPAPAQ